jgi:hypothetical protein
MTTGIAYPLIAVAVLAILLGFVALLLQKNYLDVNNNMKTEVEVPLFGKMTTNFPALVFLFIGAAIIGVVAYRAPSAPPASIVIWSVSAPAVQLAGGVEIKKADWDTKFKVNLLPDNHPGLDLKRENEGHFTLNLPLIEGTSFEQAVKEIVFELEGDTYFTCSLNPEEELKIYQNDKANSILSSVNDGVRVFKTIKLRKGTDLDQNQSCKN